MDIQQTASQKHGATLFLIKNEYEPVEFKNTAGASYSITELTVDLSIVFKKTDGRFIDELADFYRSVKESATQNRIKLKGFKTDKKTWTVNFKANGTPKNLNDLLTELKAGTVKFA
ncbi:MAG: hypothetical protein ACYCSB_01295 [bacterium]|jgi:hypothetical protein